jgi:RNA polymerase sigma-70 factor (ECF subfamily)
MTTPPSGWVLSARETIAAWEGAALGVSRWRPSSDGRVAGGGVETELIARSQRGDHEAYACLLEAGLADRLLGVARWILRDVGLAEDAAQQALLTIWRDLPRLRDTASFDAWAYRILVRASHAEGRRQRRWIPGIARTAPDHGTRTDGLGWIADRDELESAFRRLSLDHRTVVVLRYYLDLPIERIAELLGIPGGTVQSRLHYAMRALRAALDADARTTRRHRRG